MKVLMIVDPFHPCPQSSSQRLYSFAQAFSAENFKVTVVAGTRCFGKIGISALTEKNLKVYDLRCPSFLLSLSSLIVNPFLVLLYFFISIIIALKERVNLIITSVPNGETAIAGFFVSKVLRIPFVVDMRDLYPFPSAREIIHVPIPPLLSSFLSVLFRFLYKNSSMIICAYERIKEELATAGVSAERAFVITNGADISIYHPSTLEKRKEIRLNYGLPLDKIIFVYAGTLASFYPIGDLVTGFGKIYQTGKNLQLLIISFKNYDQYKRMAEELKIEDGISFMGPFPPWETAKILSVCDVGIVPFLGDERFLKDMYGAKIFSYMSCELPILASGPEGGFLEALVKEHNTGFFLGKPSAVSFARGFTFFSRNKSKMKIMGQNARKLVEEHYDRRKLGLELASLLYARFEEEGKKKNWQVS